MPDWMPYMICYQMDMSYKPLEYKCIIPFPASWLHGGCGSASNLMKKSPYPSFGAPARYSYLDATWGNLTGNKGHFQREAPWPRMSMSAWCGYTTSRTVPGLIIPHVRLSPREYGRNAGDVEHRTCPSSSPVVAPTVSRRSGMASLPNRPGRSRRTNHES